VLARGQRTGHIGDMRENLRCRRKHKLGRSAVSESGEQKGEDCGDGDAQAR